MNPELKTRWVKALRSGDYKQTRGQLYDGEGPPRLGVLCEIQREELGGCWDRGHFLVDGAVLCTDETRTPGGPHRLRAEQLAHLNDQGRTFAEIADYIEARL